jgi:esterase/lipase superfamily enzyme
VVLTKVHQGAHDLAAAVGVAPAANARDLGDWTLGMSDPLHPSSQRSGAAAACEAGQAWAAAKRGTSIQPSGHLRGATFWLAALCFVMLLAGCDAPVRLMPTPLSFRSGDVDPFEKAGYKVQGTDLPVFYVTNRGAVIEKPEPIYTLLPSERLRMGVAHMRIGDDTLDWETLHRLSTSDDPDERPIIHLEGLEQMAALGPGETVAGSTDAKAFFATVNKALAASEKRELVVYVHGANNTVARASAQAAQLRHFTGRRVVMLSFLWPSTGSILRYFTDVGHAATSVAPFARMIEALAEHTNASSIDVVAFSAGAQVVSPALVKLATPRPGETREQLRQRLRLSQVYFAAPDIDTRRFANELAQFIDIVGRVSIAANLNDSALRFSAVVNRASRAGSANPTELDAEQTGFLVDASSRLGFDVIKVDPNAIPKLPPRSHAFWFEDPWVSGDLLGLLLLNAEPQRRGLEPQVGPLGARYWTFPPDFKDRVQRLFIPTPAASSSR